MVHAEYNPSGMCAKSKQMQLNYLFSKIPADFKMARNQTFLNFWLGTSSLGGIQSQYHMFQSCKGNFYL